MEEMKLTNEETVMEEMEPVSDDFSAERMLNRRAERIAERDRLIDDCKKMLEYYTNRIEEIEASYKPSIEYYEAQLYAFATIMPTKETETQKSYKLPSGKLVITKAKKDFSPNKEKMLEYFKKNRPELVKVKEEPDWASFKKELCISDDSVYSEATGELIECVEVVEKPESFKIS